MTTYIFLIPLLVGFALVGASAFTAAYSRRWGEKGGQTATFVLRTALGIPMWSVGYLLAWLEPQPDIFESGFAVQALGWLLVGLGSIPMIWGHFILGWRTGMPSIRDTLVRSGLCAHVRHPIYSGMILILMGLAPQRPTSAVLLAFAISIVWVVIQARLEEIDLVQRLPAYREYMEQVPRFVPRLRRRQLGVA